MTDSRAAGWRQMRFLARDGRVEILWVQPERGVESGYRVLNVPVWQYGVSVGSLVEGRQIEAERLEFVRMLDEAAGGTLRLYTPPGAPDASKLYLERVLTDCRELSIGVGPATFFDPRLVAIHLHRWEDDHEAMIAYLDQLVAAGVIQEWEIGDPVSSLENEPQEPAREEELVHPRPTSQRDKYFEIPDEAT